jgi:hypothetical protein
MPLAVAAVWLAAALAPSALALPARVTTRDLPCAAGMAASLVDVLDISSRTDCTRGNCRWMRHVQAARLRIPIGKRLGCSARRSSPA